MARRKGRHGPKGVSCSACGEQWPRDPALEVRCPVCRASVGMWCRRPGGTREPEIHVARDLLAQHHGLLKKCPGRPLTQPRTATAAAAPGHPVPTDHPPME